MGAPIATLKDNFTDNLIANAWSPVAVGSATYSEASGRATITLPSSVASSHEAAYVSTSQYNLTGGNCYITINGMVATGVAATAYFDLRLDNNNYLRWRQVSNTITARKVVAGVDTQLYTATWSATTYKYLRIRESGGTVFFDSSTDGTTWTNRASIVGLPFAVTDLKIWMGALCGNIAAPGSLTVEDINLILPALATNWRWTQIVWPLTERFKTITLALDTAGTAQAYVAFSDSADVNGDPVSPTYWSGPADGGRELTSLATQAAAQAMAVNIPLDGRFDLPTLEEGRVIRVYHRSIDGSAYTLREVYPRRLIQADDIEAEVVRGLRVEGHQFICDYLSALSANVGTLTAGVIDGVIIYAGGATHPVTLDANGIKIVANASATDNDLNAYTFTSGGVTSGGLYAAVAVNSQLDLITWPLTGKGASISVDAYGASGQYGQLNLTAETPSGFTRIVLNSGANGDGVRISGQTAAGATLSADGGVNIGTAAGAGAGMLITSGVVALHGALLDANIGLSVRGSGLTTTTRGLRVADSAGNISLDVYDDGSIATRAGVRYNFGAWTAGSTIPVNGFVTAVIAGVSRRLLTG